MSEAVYGDTSPDFFDAARTPGETTHEDFYEAPDGQRHKVEIYIVGDEDPAPPIAQETEEERRYRAQQAFATHVAAVKQQGDPLDQLPNLRVRNSLLRASIPAVTAAELAAINPGLAITGGIIATAATVFGGRRANKKQSNAAYESLSATFGAQIGVGEYYELHRPTVSKKKIEAGLADDNLELYWYCPLKYDNEEPIREHLGRMAELAKSQGIQKMRVSRWAMLELQKARAFAVNPETMNDATTMVRKSKKLLSYTSGNSHSSVTTATPDQWLEIARQTNGELDIDVLRTLATKLASVSDGDPLVSIIAQYQNDPELLKQELRKHAANAVDRNLDNIDYFRNPHYRAAQRNEYVPPEAGAQVKATSFFRETGSARAGTHVAWNTRFGKKLRDLLASADITEAEYEQLLEMPEINRPKARRALELAIYQTAHDQPVPVYEKNTATTQQPGQRPVDPGLQHQLLNNANKRANFLPQRIAQVAAVGAFVISAFLGSDKIHDGMDSMRDNAIASAQYQLAKEQHKNADDVNPDLAEQAVNDKYPLLRGWDVIGDTEDNVEGNWNDLKDGIGDFFDSETSGANSDSPVEENELPASSSQTNQAIGNSPLGKDDFESQFTISTKGAISTEGYWASATSPKLSLEMQNGDLTMSWQQVDQISNMEYLGTNADKKLYPGLIKVERKLSKDDSITLFDGEADPDEPANSDEGQYNAVNIPVLEDTKPVAVNIAGQSVRLITKKDNTYAVETNGIDSDYLTYWLAADPKAPKPKFTQAAYTESGPDVDSTNVNSGVLLPYMYDKTGKQAGDFVKGEFGKQFEEYVESKWDYERSPFTKEEEKSWKGLADFARSAITDEDANCNVANTLEVVANPHTRNAVFGYLNSGNGKESLHLSGNELHMWNTKGDATPNDRIATQPATSEETSNSTDQTINTLQTAGLAIAGLGIGGTVLNLGDKLAFAASQRRRRKTLAGATNEQVATARAAAEILTYSRGGIISEQATRRRASQLAKTSPSTGLELAEQTVITTPQVATALTRTAAELPEGSSFAAELNSSAQVVNTARQFRKAEQRGPYLRYIAKSLVGKALRR